MTEREGIIEGIAKTIWFRGPEWNEMMWEHMQEMHRAASREQAEAVYHYLEGVIGPGLAHRA